MKAEQLNTVSVSVVEKLLNDPEFKAAFLKDPLGTLRKMGVPEDLLPADATIDAAALEKALKLADDDGRVTAFVVAAVVI